MYASPPTVYADSFETLQVFSSWSEGSHTVCLLPSDYFCHFFFLQNKLSRFPDIITFKVTR